MYVHSILQKLVVFPLHSMTFAACRVWTPPGPLGSFGDKAKKLPNFAKSPNGKFFFELQS